MKYLNVFYVPDIGKYPSVGRTKETPVSIETGVRFNFGSGDRI